MQQTATILALMWRAYNLILRIMGGRHMTAPGFCEVGKIGDRERYLRDMAKVRRIDLIYDRLIARLRVAIRAEGIDPATIVTPYDP